MLLKRTTLNVLLILNLFVTFAMQSWWTHRRHIVIIMMNSVTCIILD